MVAACMFPTANMCRCAHMLSGEDSSGWRLLAGLSNIGSLDLTASNAAIADAQSIINSLKGLSVLVFKDCSFKSDLLAALQQCPLTVLQLGGHIEPLYVHTIYFAYIWPYSHYTTSLHKACV